MGEESNKGTPSPDDIERESELNLHKMGTRTDKILKYTTIITSILTFFAVVIAAIGIYLAKESLDKARKSLELSEKGFKKTEESLEITRWAFNFEVLKSKPQFIYTLTATICPSNPEKNDFQATIEFVEGIPVRGVSIKIVAGVLGTKEQSPVFNYWRESMQPKDRLVFDKNNPDFIQRMNRNIKAIDPDVFSQKKLNLLKLYAEYCIDLGSKTIPYSDDKVAKLINPEYVKE